MCYSGPRGPRGDVKLKTREDEQLYQSAWMLGADCYHYYSKAQDAKSRAEQGKADEIANLIDEVIQESVCFLLENNMHDIDFEKLKEVKNQYLESLEKLKMKGVGHG